MRFDKTASSSEITGTGKCSFGDWPTLHDIWNVEQTGVLILLSAGYAVRQQWICHSGDRLWSWRYWHVKIHHKSVQSTIYNNCQKSNMQLIRETFQIVQFGHQIRLQWNFLWVSPSYLSGVVMWDWTDSDHFTQQFKVAVEVQTLIETNRSIDW